jgi:Sensors of blue-light using FAD
MAKTFSNSSIAATEEGEGDEDPIEQIVYTSSAYMREVPPEEVEQILTTSRRNNERDSITGLLVSSALTSLGLLVPAY